MPNLAVDWQFELSNQFVSSQTARSWTGVSAVGREGKITIGIPRPR
jgi:hypothetical protein